MSKVKINDTFTVEGQFSFDASYDMRSNPPMIDIRGVFSSKDGYLSNIHSLENSRYALDGVYVYQESYGSEEDEIAYYFTAKSFAIENRLREVKMNQ